MTAAIIPDADYISRHTEPELNTGCWLWSGGLGGRGGYGLARLRGTPWRAHRLSWTVHRGSIPDGLKVCHRCDTPSCVNPDHLFLGTHAENMADCSKKGRIRTGAKPSDRVPAALCKQGHPFTSESTHVDRRGRRRCKICTTAGVRRRRALLKEAHHAD